MSATRVRMIFPVLSLTAALFILPTAGHSQGRGNARPAAPAEPLPKQVHYIKASNAEGGDYFADGGANQGHTGSPIAISRDGNTMAIGAPYESGGSKGINGDQNDNSIYGSGAVYVFTRSGDTWVQQAYVKASNRGAKRSFRGRRGSERRRQHHGRVGLLRGQQAAPASTATRATIRFRRPARSTSSRARAPPGRNRLTSRRRTPGGRADPNNPDDWGDGDQFGFSIALSRDGNTLAVGAVSEDSRASGINNLAFQNDDSSNTSGAVYVFARTGTTWSQQAYIKPSNSEAGDMFGYSVALSADGNDLGGECVRRARLHAPDQWHSGQLWSRGWRVARLPQGRRGMETGRLSERIEERIHRPAWLLGRHQR